jgi:hypothetical protein
MAALLLTVMLSFLLPSGTVSGQELERHNYKPAAGYVPNEETAIKIALVVWTPIYGEEVIRKEKPFKAVLKDDSWYVSGSLPAGFRGGVAEAEIAKDDGRVLRVSHGK